MQKHSLGVIAVGVVATAMLTATGCKVVDCNVDGDCATGAMCDTATHACVAQTCKGDGDCPTNWTCDRATELCEPPPLPDGGLPDATGDGGTKCSSTNATVCAPYVCNIKTGDPEGTCLETCSDNDDCQTGYVCNTATYACVAEALPFVYVAVVSATTATSDLDITTPGPDIDAVEIARGSTSYFAKFVALFEQGTGGEPGMGNNYDDENDVIGMPDAIMGLPTGDPPVAFGSCNLSSPGRFWSMGDGTGFAIVSFQDSSNADVDLAVNDVIRVWELDPTTCNDVTTTRDDKYEVYLGTAEDLDALTTDAVSITATWQYLGMSTSSGGIFEGVYTGG
jgi:hypothetical protein